MNDATVPILAAPARRRASWPLAALALAFAGPAAAAPREKALPVAIYLPSTETLTKDEAADVEAVLVSGLHQAARSGTLAAREPVLLRPSCGRSPTDACLAGLAGDGAVLLSRARRDGLHVVVSMALVNGKGKRTRWTSFITTLAVQDARPCAQALYFLEDELSRPGSGVPLAAAPGRAPEAAEPMAASPAPRPPPAQAPAPPPPVVAAAEPEPPRSTAAAAPEPEPAPTPASVAPAAARPGPTPAPAPAAASPAPSPAPAAVAEVPIPPPPDLRPAPPPRPVVVRPAPPPPPPSPAPGWSSGKVAGAWLTGGGLLVSAAGGYAALHARSLDGRLTDKFNAGTLTPADASTYGDVRRWSRAANVLLAAGGVVTAGGAALFLLSPTVEPVAGGGLAVGLAGRF